MLKNRIFPKNVLSYQKKTIYLPANMILDFAYYRNHPSRLVAVSKSPSRLDAPCTNLFYFETLVTILLTTHFSK